MQQELSFDPQYAKWQRELDWVQSAYDRIARLIPESPSKAVVLRRLVSREDRLLQQLHRAEGSEEGSPEL
jgi:hypothetical protein